jgi:hypothetical protein
MKKLCVGGKMKRKSWLFVICYLSFIVLFLWGCGSGPGSPGSSGSEDTGIRIRAVSITKDSPDIDVYASPTACDGKAETPLTRESATMSVESEMLNPNSTVDPYPASVEQCTITYKKAIEDPSAPTIESLTIYPNCSLGGCPVTCPDICSVTLIDIDRKVAYLDAITGGQNNPAEYPTHYIAQYNCKYVNNFGKSGTFQVEYDFWLADFLTCGG